jgi:DtxR family Mn-dependent transcriptional regulator
MGFTWDQVDVEAHRLEHAISSAFEERIDRLCGCPTHCPHGDPIPQKDGALPDERLLSLVEMQPGQGGILRRVGTNDARVLRYLTQLALEPGRSLRLIDLAPFNGPVTLELLNGANGNTTVATQMLGSELAAQLYIHPQLAESHG